MCFQKNLIYRDLVHKSEGENEFQNCTCNVSLTTADVAVVQEPPTALVVSKMALLLSGKHF